MYNDNNTGNYFEMQRSNCKNYIIPFIQEKKNIISDTRILETGCGTAGVLAAFLEAGCQGAGVDINENSINYAKRRLADHKNIILITKDIYKIDLEKDLHGKFDIIVLKDVIEHIPNQEKLFTALKNFLCSDGVIFFGFPPWQMPFGGHQQVLSSRVLSHAPYLHLLPMPIYKKVMRLFNNYSEEHIQLKKTGLSIERFEQITKDTGYEIINRQFHLINPIYQYRYGIKMRKQSKYLSSIPYLRNFITTSVFYLIKPLNHKQQ
ncbi:MAG: class I SAM-dependent methyltransferase [Dysgonamonadaceae bacterium]|jgi:SAM-dependent methyltransferase|nr:class I SAM-dependent methyltransferase [Dysgonamonadaceae bacterium]